MGCGVDLHALKESAGMGDIAEHAFLQKLW